jgi:hypothetical protein
MKHVRTTTSARYLGFLFACGAVGAATASGGDSVCDQTAMTIRRGAQRQAQADFAMRIAACLQSPHDFDECYEDAKAEFLDSIELFHEQYDARLEVCDLVGGGPYDPDLDEDEFSPDVDNPFLPLVVGRTLVYEKVSDEGTERIEFTALADTIDIDEVPCRVVHDVVTLDGVLIEDTFDWISQHEDGTVWYLGEIVQNFEEGVLDSIDGSWAAGKNEAEPGILMLPDPEPGDAYRQEFAIIDEAEDVAMVIAEDVTVTVPAGTFHDCVQTLEWTPIEPDVFEHKYYAAGVGLVLEVDVDTGERTELVRIIH